MQKYTLKDGNQIELFQHQIEGIEFLKERKTVVLAHSMGLGKTRQAIIASEKRVIVVCPASIKINWKREIEIVYPNDNIFIVESGTKQEIPDSEWVIINYDMLPKYKDDIKGAGFQTAIIDEAHYIKGKTTIRAKTTLEVVDDIERVYCLTGTPIMNRPIEMFNLLRAIRHDLGKKGNATIYSKRYCNGHMETIFRRYGGMVRYWDETGATNIAELRELTKDSILRRTKEEVLDLPEKIISIQTCKLNNLWQKEYDIAWDKYIEWVRGNPEGKDIENILSAQHLIELGKLKQVCSRAKTIRVTEDILNAVEQGQKVVVFSQYTETINILCDNLKVKKIKAVRLTGQNSMDERQDAVDRFQNDEDVKVFVANIKAGGVGINLTSASIVMFADMEWSPEIHNQASDRLHRIGQKQMVNVYYYVAEDTIEEDIIAILETKRKIINELIGGSDIDTSISREFMKLLKKRL